MKSKNNLGAYLWIMGILAVLVLGMVGANAMVKTQVSQRQAQKKVLTITPTAGVITPKPNRVFTGEVTAPVSKEMLVSVYPDDGTAMSHLILNLVAGTEIKAGIAGEVIGSSPGPDNEGVGVQIRGEGELVVSYLYTGTTTVKAGQKVIAGEVIGQIERGKAPSCLGTGNMGMYIGDKDSGLYFKLDQLKELPVGG